jgi:hypothetical protein
MIVARSKTVVAACLLTVLAVGCTRQVSGVATGQQKITGTTNACNFVSAPLTPIPAQADDELRIVMPQPSGWVRESEHESESVRFAMANGSLRAGRVAVAAVSLKTKVGHHDPATVFVDVRRKAERDSGTRDLTVTDAKVCGYPAQTFRYTRLATDELPTRTETLLMVVVPSTGKSHAAWVTITTNDANSPDYQRAADTILSGFQVLAPTE